MPLKINFGSTARETGTNKNIDFHGDGIWGQAKPYTKRTGKKIARRARRQYDKLMISSREENEYEKV